MASQKYNSGEHIDDIISRTDCINHSAPEGFPCFQVRYGNGKSEYGPGICGPRIRKAGFNGEITPMSLSRGSTKKQPNPRR